MAEPVQAPVATIDWLPPRVALRRRALDAAIEAFERAGFGQVITPTFEDTRLFSRTSGETSDVVSKEMYTFTDRGHRSLTLRPEGTAPVVRAFIERGLKKTPLPARLWYHAPMFRYAKAQRGRYREHWQFGVEVIGSAEATADAEVIATQAAWYGAVGVLDRLTLHLNSIGDRHCRPAYRDLLVAFLRGREAELSHESKERLERNPLRVLDGKEPEDRAVVAGAPRITDHLCDACQAHFDEVRALLDARGVAYALDPLLVRGLDYYERTAWEWVTPEEGGQASTVSGGGRYDGLAELIGGEPTPGVGFGCGLERLVLLMEDIGQEPPSGAPDVFVAIGEPAARPAMFALVDQLRAQGLHAEADLGGRSLNAQMKHAGRLGARVRVICGPEDWARGTVRVGGDDVPIGEAAGAVARRLEAG